MKKTGFLCDLKGLVAKYIVDITKQNGNHQTNVIPERVDEVILAEIGAYLQWVGMKNTLAVLVSESPVPMNVNFNNDDESVPKLVSLFHHLEGSSAIVVEEEEEEEEDAKEEEEEEEEVAKETPEEPEADKSEEAISTSDILSLDDLKETAADDTQDVTLSNSEGLSGCDYQEDV